MKKQTMEFTPIKNKKHEPIVYDYYDYLKKYCLGRENGISRNRLCEMFKVTLDTQKHILREINNSLDFDKMVSTSGSIYICNTEQECKIAIHNEIQSGLARLNKGKTMAKKLGRNGQYIIKLGKYYRDFMKTFEE